MNLLLNLLMLYIIELRLRKIVKTINSSSTTAKLILLQRCYNSCVSRLAPLSAISDSDEMARDVMYVAMQRARR